MIFPRIDALAAHLHSLRPLNEAERKRLRDEFSIENTYNSNAIEGNTLTLRETALILQEGITIAEKPIREHLEVIGHKDAFDSIIAVADRGEPLTERVIRNVHSLVLMNDASNRGVYRRVPVSILGATLEPPPPYLVPEKITALVEEYPSMRERMHTLEAVALFHLRFESIHPFVDGNGRTGRLLLNLELIKAGLLPVNIKFGDRRKYYDAFDAYAEDGSPAALADLIAGYEEEELARYISLIEGASTTGDTDK